MKNKTVAHLLNGLVLLAIFALTLEAYKRVPERMPVHYNFNGNPDRWVEKNLIEWMVPFYVSLFITGMFYLIGLFLPWFKDHPELINLPGKQKQKFLQMIPEQRIPILQGMAEYLYWFPITVNWMFLWMAASGKYSCITNLFPKLHIMWILAITLLSTAVLTVLMIKKCSRLVKDSFNWDEVKDKLRPN